MIKVILPGEPVRRISPTFSKFGTYDTQKTILHANKFQTLDQVRKYSIIPFPKNVPIEIEISYFFAIPKTKENLFQWGLLDHIDTPDVDNLTKFYLDVLKKTVFEDDRQVNILNAFKHYSENPRTEICIMPKKQSCDDKVKEVLALIPPSEFSSIGDSLVSISNWVCNHENPFHLRESTNIDYEEAAFLILDFAEQWSEKLKKINKKFPGLAKVLEARMKEK